MSILNKFTFAHARIHPLTPSSCIRSWLSRLAHYREQRTLYDTPNLLNGGVGLRS